MYDDEEDDIPTPEPLVPVVVLPPVSRYFQRDNEACRLHAIRPRVTLDCEHPGRLRTTLQPVCHGVVQVERAAVIGWCTPEEIDAYAQHIVAQGWMEVARITHGLYHQTAAKQLETRLERLRSHQANGCHEGAVKERAAIRLLCRQHGLLVPAEAALQIKRSPKRE